MSNVEQDTYQSWMERVVSGREARPLEPGELVKTPDAEPFATIEFVRVPCRRYIGEVGKKNGDYIFHFFPKEGEEFKSIFEDFMADAFLEVFQFEDRIESAWSEELHSWAVKAIGFANNPGADAMAFKVFSVLDRRLDDAS